MSLLERFRHMDGLDFQQQHPIVGFFNNHELTDSRINMGLPLLILFFVYGAISQTSWSFLVFAVGTTVLMWRNYRRYRQRLFFAVADRDRPPGSDLRHPDTPAP